MTEWREGNEIRLSVLSYRWHGLFTFCACYWMGLNVEKKRKVLDLDSFAKFQPCAKNFGHYLQHLGIGKNVGNFLRTGFNLIRIAAEEMNGDVEVRTNNLEELETNFELICFRPQGTCANKAYIVYERTLFSMEVLEMSLSTVPILFVKNTFFINRTQLKRSCARIGCLATPLQNVYFLHIHEIILRTLPVLQRNTAEAARAPLRLT